MTQVTVTFALEPELADRIRAVDPSVRVRVLNEPGLSTLEGEGRFPSQRQALTPPAEIEAALDDSEVLFAYWGDVLEQLVRPDAFPASLRWVQLFTAGAERVDPALIRDCGLTVTTVTGMHAVPISEFVLTYMLMFAKGWPALLRNQLAVSYDRSVVPEDLEGKTVGIIGMGAIGAAVATRARALGCRVLGMRRSFTSRGPDDVADGGAALDVFHREPLPPESPLWQLDNVILTPHLTGGPADYAARATAMFCDNLACYLAGEPLHNVYDPARGY